MEIKEPRMGLRMVKECLIPGHPIIIVIKGLYDKLYRKTSFFKGIFPLLGAQNIVNNAFGKQDETRVNFVEIVGYVN